MIEDREIINGRIFVNNQEQFSLDDNLAKMIAYFIHESGMLAVIKKYQGLSKRSLEEATNLYLRVLPELEDDDKRPASFEIIQKIFDEFEYESALVKANVEITDESSLYDIWWGIIGYCVSATSKDLSVIIRIVDHADGVFPESE